MSQVDSDQSCSILVCGPSFVDQVQMVNLLVELLSDLDTDFNCFMGWVLSTSLVVLSEGE